MAFLLNSHQDALQHTYSVHLVLLVSSFFFLVLENTQCSGEMECRVWAVSGEVCVCVWGCFACVFARSVDVLVRGAVALFSASG